MRSAGWQLISNFRIVEGRATASPSFHAPFNVDLVITRPSRMSTLGCRNPIEQIRFQQLNLIRALRGKIPVFTRVSSQTVQFGAIAVEEMNQLPLAPAQGGAGPVARAVIVRVVPRQVFGCRARGSDSPLSTRTRLRPSRCWRGSSREPAEFEQCRGIKSMVMAGAPPRCPASRGRAR